MVPPQVPGGRAKGQTIFYDEPHGQGDDPMRIATSDRSQVAHVRVEIDLVFFTAMLGINHLEVMGPARSKIPQIMQPTTALAIPVASLPTDRAFPPSIAPGTIRHNRLGQVFRLDDLPYVLLILRHGVASCVSFQHSSVCHHPAQDARKSRLICYTLEKSAYFLPTITSWSGKESND
jgi:hypothetical protein